MDTLIWSILAPVASLASVLLYVSRPRLGIYLGMLSFFPWLGLALSTQAWGLIPTNCIFVYLHYRNLQMIRKET